VTAVTGEKLYEALLAKPELVEHLGDKLGIDGYAKPPSTVVEGVGDGS
jgi:hypothetical protein